MRLYYTPGSCALSCHIALERAGVPYDVVELTQFEAHAEEYARINPKRKVPALQMGDEVLTEAAAILVHVAEAHPRSGLLPEAGLPRSRMIEALSELTGEFHPAFAPLHVPGRYAEDEAAHDALKRTSRSRIAGHYDRWAERMEDRAHVLGAEPCAADPYLYVMCRWSAMIDAPISDWPPLSRFAARIEGWDATRAALAAQGLEPLDPDPSRVT